MKPHLAFALCVVALILVTALILTAQGLDWITLSPATQSFLFPATVVICLLGSLAFFLRIYPRRPAIWLMLVPALLSLGLLYTESPIFLGLILVFDTVVALLLLVDLVMLPAPTCSPSTGTAGGLPRSGSRIA